MRDEQERSLIGDQSVLENLLCAHINVVGGLVHEQEIGLGQHQACQKKPGLFAAGQRAHSLKHIVAGKKKGGQDAPQLALGKMHVNVPEGLQEVFVIKLL